MLHFFFWGGIPSTWNLKTNPWKRRIPNLETIIFRFCSSWNFGVEKIHQRNFGRSSRIRPLPWTNKGFFFSPPVVQRWSWKILGWRDVLEHVEVRCFGGKIGKTSPLFFFDPFLCGNDFLEDGHFEHLGSFMSISWEPVCWVERGQNLPFSNYHWDEFKGEFWCQPTGSRFHLDIYMSTTRNTSCFGVICYVPPLE